MIINDAIRAINDGPHKIFAAITGGGTGWVTNYLSYGGGSATILGAYIPYAQELTAEFLGYEPDGYVTERVARDLALRSYEKTVLHGGGWNAIGIGVTASLTRVTNERENRVNKFYISIHGNDATLCGDYTLVKKDIPGFDQRKEQELAVENEIFNLLFKFLGINFNLKSDIVTDIHFEYVPSVPVNLSTEHTCLVFPGSFNPLHDGHIKMMTYAKELFPDLAPIFEITLNNRDKRAIDWIDVRWRETQFDCTRETMYDAVFFTDKKTFVEKSALFGEGSVFILGYDTFERLIYDLNALKTAGHPDPHGDFRSRKVRLLVFPRNGISVDKIKETVTEHTDIFFVVDTWTQIDISSTQLRNTKK